MGNDISRDSSSERVWSARLTGPQAMVVSSPSVARTVCLHTAIMGIHRACRFIEYREEVDALDGGTRIRPHPILCIPLRVAHQLASARLFCPPPPEGPE